MPANKAGWELSPGRESFHLTLGYWLLHIRVRGARETVTGIMASIIGLFWKGEGVSFASCVLFGFWLWSTSLCFSSDSSYSSFFNTVVIPEGHIEGRHFSFMHTPHGLFFFFSFFLFHLHLCFNFFYRVILFHHHI